MNPVKRITGPVPTRVARLFHNVNKLVGTGAGLFSAVAAAMTGWFGRHPPARQPVFVPRAGRTAAWLQPRPCRHLHRRAHAGQKTRQRARNRRRTAIQKLSRRINWGLT